MAARARGRILPDDEVRDIWLVGDRLTFARPPGHHDTIVDGGWLLPGLVDAHAHPGHRADGRFSPRLFTRQCRELVRAGVSAVRIPGSAVPVPQSLVDRPGMPRVVRGGRWLAWSGLGSVDGHHPVDDLAGSVDTGSGALWHKLIGDWDPFAPPVPEESLGAAVAVAHAAGGRVAVHCQTPAGCRSAVLAGADSLEHGMHLDTDLLDIMARAGQALVPTLDVFARDLVRVGAQPAGPRRDWFLGGFAGSLVTVRAAHEAGVAVYPGTDAVGERAGFDRIAHEVGWLVRAGVPASAAVAAASWGGREWLGLTGLVEGGLADLVAYEEDPRVRPEVLAHPRRVISRGRVVR